MVMNMTKSSGLFLCWNKIPKPADDNKCGKQVLCLSIVLQSFMLFDIIKHLLTGYSGDIKYIDSLETNYYFGFASGKNFFLSGNNKFAITLIPVNKFILLVYHDVKNKLFFDEMIMMPVFDCIWIILTLN
jgi:hypothetical protein